MPSSRSRNSHSTQRVRHQRPSWFNDFLAFRAMLAPILIQIIFWAGVIFCFVTGRAMIMDAYSHAEAIEAWSPSTRMYGALGILLIVVGPILVRLICESWILFFRMNETLTLILHEHRKANRRS